MLLTPGVSALLHNLTTLGITLNAMRPHLPPASEPEWPLEEDGRTLELLAGKDGTAA